MIILLISQIAIFFLFGYLCALMVWKKCLLQVVTSDCWLAQERAKTIEKQCGTEYATKFNSEAFKLIDQNNYLKYFSHPWTDLKKISLEKKLFELSWEIMDKAVQDRSSGKANDQRVADILNAGMELHYTKNEEPQDV